MKKKNKKEKLLFPSFFFHKEKDPVRVENEEQALALGSSWGRWDEVFGSKISEKEKLRESAIQKIQEIKDVVTDKKQIPRKPRAEK